MENGRRLHRLGLFMVVGLTILLAVLFLLGGRQLFQPTYVFETYFDESVAGLDIGAPVRFRGVPLGVVSQILTSSIDYESSVPLSRRRNYIVVRAKIIGSAVREEQLVKEAAEMVKLGLRTQTQLAGITGSQYLALDYLDPAHNPPLPFEWKPKYEYVPSAPSLAGQIVENAQAFLANLNKADVARLSQNLDKLLVTMNERLDKVQVEQLSADAHTLLTNLNTTVTHVNRLVGKPGIANSVDNLEAMTANLRKYSESGDIKLTLQRISELAERLNGLIGDNQYDTRLIVQDLRVTVDNLRAMSASLKRYPAGALLGGPPEKVKLPETSP
jgi:phospholipid/cholesterol/gamma-HCH transport system substrate-binding protein/paraquat-inducible protein B